MQKEAQVKIISNKETTIIERMLTKERVQNAEESKERRRVNFPRIEELRMKALNAKVGNDKIWKHQPKKDSS